MKSYPGPPTPQEITDKIRVKVNDGVSQQDVIWAMRREGLQIVECMRLVHLFYRVPRNEAKDIVHFSDAWVSLRSNHDAFHDNVESAAGEMERRDSEWELRSVS